MSKKYKPKSEVQILKGLVRCQLKEVQEAKQAVWETILQVSFTVATVGQGKPQTKQFFDFAVYGSLYVLFYF